MLPSMLPSICYSPYSYVTVHVTVCMLLLVYNVYEMSSSARGEFQSKTNVFHGFYNVLYSWRVY